MKNALLSIIVCAYICCCSPACAAAGRPYETQTGAPYREFFFADEKTFVYAVKNAREYGTFDARAGVVPHHLTAAPLIAGFFKAIRDGGEAIETVVVVGPDHEGADGEITVSGADWDNRVLCDAGLIDAITGVRLTDGKIESNDAIIKADHAVGALVPFIGHYLPGAKIAPVLLNKSLSYGDAFAFAGALADIINTSGKKILLLCSIDFSHYLTPKDARVKDAETILTMERCDYRELYAFNDAHADCRAALIVFLYFLEVNGLELTVVDHTDASAFTGPCADETTSYFILVGQ